MISHHDTNASTGPIKSCIYINLKTIYNRLTPCFIEFRLLKDLNSIGIISRKNFTVKEGNFWYSMLAGHTFPSRTYWFWFHQRNQRKVAKELLISVSSDSIIWLNNSLKFGATSKCSPRMVNIHYFPDLESYKAIEEEMLVWFPIEIAEFALRRDGLNPLV